MSLKKTSAQVNNEELRASYNISLNIAKEKQYIVVENIIILSIKEVIETVINRRLVLFLNSCL